jgi:sigma-E factor negative regulatory protein RseB
LGARSSALLALACLTALPALASEAAALGEQEARAWIARIHGAAVRANYTGTLVYSGGGGLSSARVWHYCVGDQTYERLEALSGRQQSIVRHNEAVQTVWPQTRVAVLERREAMVAWTTTPQALEPFALQHYTLQREGRARVAGRDAVVLVLTPRDALRYAQRQWADEISGLMLRADVLGPGPGRSAGTEEVLESTAFSEVTIGGRAQPDAVLGALPNLDEYRVLRPHQQRSSLEAEGWQLARPVPGFRAAGCVRRDMQTTGDAVPVLQTVFADGLTHVSVFIEPFDARRHPHELRQHRGATGTLAVRRGEHWVTVVGDVPPATLQMFADAFERRRP